MTRYDFYKEYVIDYIKDDCTFLDYNIAICIDNGYDDKILSFDKEFIHKTILIGGNSTYALFYNKNEKVKIYPSFNYIDVDQISNPNLKLFIEKARRNKKIIDFLVL